MLHFPRFTTADLELLKTRHGYHATHKTMDVYEVLSQDGVTRATFFKDRHGYGAMDAHGLEVANAQSDLAEVFRSPFSISAKIRCAN